MADRKRYESVSDLVRDTAPDPSFYQEFEEHRSARRLTKQLVAMRAIKGLSQGDIAKRLACTQSRVSKLENSRDNDMRLGDLRGYAEALDCYFVVGAVPRSVTTVDRVKAHVFQIKKHTDDLAKLAQSDEHIAAGVAQFFFELVMNFGRLVGSSVRRLPVNANGLPYIDFNVMVDQSNTAEGRSSDPEVPSAPSSSGESDDLTVAAP
jgi:transcriptional regulator with XRE-family HTH domain